jgi:gliding motility-associated-like protein
MKVLTIFLIAFLGFFIIDTARAAHIVGGEVYYRFVRFNADKTQVTYRIEFVVYRDTEGQGSGFDNPGMFGIYEDIGTWEIVDVVESRSGTIDPIIPQDDPCRNEPSNVGVERTDYQFEYTFDINGNDYMIAYQRCCRNITINNIRDPGQTGAVFNIVLTNHAQLIGNSSPRFKDFPPIFICQGLDLSFDHSAIDIDPEGDVLRYLFCSPIQAGGPGFNPTGRCDVPFPNPRFCRPEFDKVIFVPPFSAQAPLGGNPVISIDPIEGLIVGRPEASGQFVVGVCVEEFRDGVLLSTVRRDFQFNVVPCPAFVFADFDLEMITDDSLIGMSDCSTFVINSCGELSVKITNRSQEKDSIFSYHWMFLDDDGTILLDEEGGSEIRDIYVRFPGVGQYTGSIILNEGYVCSDSACFVVNILPEIEAGFSFDYDTCAISPIVFEDLSVAGATGGVLDWSWKFKNQVIAIDQNPIFQFPETGILPVKLIVTDINNCTDAVTIDVDYRPIESKVSMDPSKFVGCNPAEVFFENLSTPMDSEVQFFWDFGDGNFSSEFSPSHMYEEPGLYTIQLDMVFPFGCQYSEDFPLVRILEGPSTDFAFSPDNSTNFEPQVHFTDLSLNADRWFWDFGGVETSTLQNPSFDFPDTGLFQVKLTSFHPTTNCTDTITRTVDIMPAVMLQLPNAFTPNNDAKNDFFTVSGSFDGLFDYNMSIWNRWGEKVYETTDIRIGWNGLKNNSGEESPQGIYVYKVIYSTGRGDRQVQEGHVTLLR